MTESVKLKIELPKIPDIELVALEGLERLAKHLGIPDEKVGEAKIVITEAIINGFEHGGNDQDRVDVEFTIDAKELVVFVQDYGKGFEPSEVEKPELVKKLGTDNKRGWGLELMKSMSDDFKIESGAAGTKIIIKKLLS